MTRRIILLTTLFVVIASSISWGQRRRSPQPPQGWDFYQPEHKVEITPFGGYVWTVSRSFSDGINRGDLDIKSSGFYGIALDLNVKPGTQLELLYQRQDSDLTFKSGGFKETLTDLAVEYWHIGAVGGIRRENVQPFTGLTLGGTRYDFKTAGFEDMWKFSVILQLGAKLYINERIGLRLQGRMPYTFLSGGVGLGCGTGGCYTSVGGTGIAQFDVSAALMILL